jgi:hypothetical protein
VQLITPEPDVFILRQTAQTSNNSECGMGHTTCAQDWSGTHAGSSINCTSGIPEMPNNKQ